MLGVNDKVSTPREYRPPVFLGVIVFLVLLATGWVAGAGPWALALGLPLVLITVGWAVLAWRARGNPLHYRRLCTQALLPLALALALAFTFTSVAATSSEQVTPPPANATEQAMQQWVSSWIAEGAPVGPDGKVITEGQATPIGQGYSVTVLHDEPELVFVVHRTGAALRGYRLWCVPPSDGTQLSDWRTAAPHACGTA